VQEGLTNLCQRLISGDDLRAQRREFADSAIAMLGGKGLNRIFHDENLAFSFKQALGGKVNTELGDHAEDYEISVPWQALDQVMSVQAFKDIQGLLFKQHLVKVVKVVGEAGVVRVGYSCYTRGERFRNKLSPGCSAYTMRRKSLELGIIRRVKATMRYQKYAFFACGISQTPDVWQQLLSTFYVQFAVGKHEIDLRIDFPEDDIARRHARRF